MTLSEFVDWFRTDLAYKAPEQWPDRIEWFFVELTERYGDALPTGQPE